MERELRPEFIRQANACKGHGEQGYVCSNTTLVNSTSNIVGSSSIYTQTLHPARILALRCHIPFPFDLHFPAHWQTGLY